MTIRRLLCELGPGEFQFWYLTDPYDPIGSWRDDARSAQVAAEVFNKGVDPDRWMTLEDFMPRYSQALEDPEASAMKRESNIRIAVAAMAGGS